MSVAMPDARLDESVLTDLEQQFGEMYQVVILDNDKTTFEEVIVSCVVLFEYTPEDAEVLAFRVHNTGEAVAHVASKEEATKYVAALSKFNVRSEARPA